MDQDHEKTLLRRHLDAQRNHVLAMIDGLSDEQLRQPVLPSGWHCLGLLTHLRIADEQYWFRCIVGGASLADLPTEPGGDWYVAPDETAAAVIDRYRQEIQRSNELLEVTDLGAPPAQPDPIWGEWGMSFPDLRSVMLHVITETAVHAGHLDAVRELLDRRQWIVLD